MDPVVKAPRLDEMHVENPRTRIEALHWDEIPFEILFPILSYLSFQDICRCSQLNRHWNEGSSSKSIWKKLCKETFTLEDQESDPKEVFKGFYNQYGIKYISCFPKVTSSWKMIEDFLQANAPLIHQTLNPGLSEKELDEFEASANLKLPLDLRLSFRIHNGQLIHDGFKGIFGGYRFYDYRVNLTLLDMKPLKKFRAQARSTDVALFADCLPVVGSGRRKHYFLHLPSGKIIEMGKTANDTFLVADNFASLLEKLAKDLTTGNFRVAKKRQEIIRFPLKEGISVQETREITVKVSPLFIPEESSASGNYYWAYQIHMSMPENAKVENHSQLTTRHWIITDANGRVEHVNGPGVIGKYPTMLPGAYFKYASCCPLPTPTGSMKGLFTMKNKMGSSFDIVVPEFFFRSAPTFSK